MNILVLGNGFDLEHGLPTKYSDFLKWIEVMNGIFKINNSIEWDNVNWRNINQQIKKQIIDNWNHGDSINKEIQDLSRENVWILHFLFMYNKLKAQGKDNWIDFETEISNVIKEMEEAISDNLDNEVVYFKEDALDYIFLKDDSPLFKESGYTVREVRDILYNDLNRLIRLLEIYMCHYVEKIDITTRSLDIDICCTGDFNNSESKNILPKVICFNYTHTFDKIYLSQYSPAPVGYMDFIHGEAKINNSIESNNMVLGVDEYLKDDKNEKVEFVGFKKFFQRIYKGTGNAYKSWLDIIRKDDLEYKEKKLKFQEELRNFWGRENTQRPIQWILNDLEKKKIKHYVFFFGHSLDVTDKDIIRDLILNDTVHTTIYYYVEYENDKRELFKKIANLVKIIGQDELIKRTGGSTKTIEFIPQQMMVSI